MSRVGSVARISKLVAASAAASLALVAAAGCSSTPSAGSSSTTATTGTVSASQDVKITACKVENKIWLMNGTVHNSSSAKRAYTVVVDFDTPGNKVVTSRKVVTGKLTPGQTISFGASGANDATGISCKIASATATS